MSNFGKCRKCRANIIWIITVSGKSMPCDPVSVAYWQDSKGKERVVTPDGEVVACRFEGDPDKVTGRGFIPHWATCPNSKEFKK